MTAYPRRLRFSPVLILTFALGGCSRDEPPEPVGQSPEQLAAQGQAAGIAPNALLPRFGGQPIVAGPRVVEVVPHADGKVEAEVRDATGQPVANAQVQAQIPTQGGAPQPVDLRYDPQTQRYVGQAPPNTTPAPGRVDVTVQPRGQGKTTGYAEAVPVAPPTSFGGQVVVTGPQAPEVRVEADGKVHAYVQTPNGELPDGDLYATVPVQGGDPVRVELEYEDDLGHYVGAVDDGQVVVPGPLEVEYDLDGVRHVGRVATFTVGPRSTLGGQVVVAGDYGVEMVEVDGQIHAAVYDVDGRPLQNRPQRVVVNVGGYPRPVVLRWNPAMGIYVCPLAPGLTIVGPPLGIEIRHGGRVHRGRFYYRAGPPGMRVGFWSHPHGGPPGHGKFRGRGPGGPPGHGKFRVRGPGRVRGPSAMVHVNGPSAMVHVNGPSAMVHVNGGGRGRVRSHGGGARARTRSGMGGGGHGMGR